MFYEFQVFKDFEVWSQTFFLKLTANTLNREFMKSPEIELSYFAAGIFAHLCCDGFQLNYISLMDWPTVLEELVRISNFFNY